MQHYDTGGVISGLTGAITPESGYTAQLAPTTMSNYAPGIAGASEAASRGFTALQGIQGQQQSLANQLQQQTLGQGPNPAQAALNANTGTNVANTAALMAGQRGASANPGLIARQAAGQGAQIQQNAVGQEATLNAQQQLSAEQLLAQQQSQLVSGTLGGQNANTNLLNANIQGQDAQNVASINNYGMEQKINADTAAANAKAKDAKSQGIVDSIGKSIPVLGQFFAHGGQIPDHLHAVGKIVHPDFIKAKNFRSGGNVAGKAPVQGDSYKNDDVPALLSPGEAVLPRSVTQSADAPNKAKEFMKHLEKGKHADAKGADPKKALGKGKGSVSARLAKLEKLCYGGMAS